LLCTLSIASGTGPPHSAEPDLWIRRMRHGRARINEALRDNPRSAERRRRHRCDEIMPGKLLQLAMALV
jgi:hypothetical protein